MEEDGLSKTVMSQPCPLDRSGSFFKLIDTFALEIGELKQEMVHTAVSLKDDPDMVVLRGPVGDISGVYLQPPSSAGAARARDSGYASLRRRMSVLDRLVHTHPAWLLLSLSDEEATCILTRQPPGTFMVRKSSKLQKKVISLRLDDQSGTPVSDFPVKESQYTFSLEGSGISFADLFRLVAFYCVSRDVLPFPLRLPEAIAGARTHTDLEEVAQLGAGFWDSALCSGKRSSKRLLRQRDQQRGRTASLPALRTRAPSQLECGQSNGALCFINPLFLRVHHPPEEEENSRPVPKQDVPPAAERGRVAWVNSRPRTVPQVQCHKVESPPQSVSMPETVCWVTHPSPSSSPVPSSAPISVPSPLRTSLRQPPIAPPDSIEDDTIERALTKLTRPSPSPSGATDILEGQRLSDMSISTSSTDSLDFSPSFLLSVSGAGPSRRSRATGDSSGAEEEEEEEEEEDYGISVGSDLEASPLPPPLKPKLQRSGGGGGTFVLPRALKGKIRKMSGMFSSLMTPEKRALHRVVELSQDKSSYFGCLVQDYISFLQENRGCHTSGEELLQTLRQFITQMKAYLCQSSELDPPIESLIPEDQIDQVLEKAMHKCVLKPLKGTVDAALQDFQVSSGAWQQLKENLALARTKQPQELGVDGAVPPDPVAIEKIRHKFHNMFKMYSPEKKVSLLLRVCKLIYTIMEDNSGRMYGADDFLPMLTYVLAQCDMPELDAEIQYMMELLDPSLLQGEGGYYLTSAYGAMSLIKNFQEEQAARVLSSETRNTLHQWHRRRTTQRFTPCVDDFQNYLRVALQEAGAGCTAKTLLVRPHFKAKEVCELCAQKFKVPDPENHALFLLVGDTNQQLAPDTHPQRIKAEIHSRPELQRFHFVYRRVSSASVPELNGNNLSS